MTQAQFLLFLISVIPIASYFILSLCRDLEKLVILLSKFLPALFFMHLVGLSNSLDSQIVHIELLKAFRDVSIGFMVDHNTLKFLFLLNFLWAIITFYSNRFLIIFESKNPIRFKLFFTLTVALVNLIIISQNLLTTLLFYNCLIMFCHFFAVKLLHNEEGKFFRIFTFSLYLESLLLFLAIVATYKFSGRIDFVSGGILPENINSAKIFLLLLLFVGGLFASILIPSYYFYKKGQLHPLTIFSLFFLSYAFGSLYVLAKVVIFIFGLNNFASPITQNFLMLLQVPLFLNFIALAILMVISKNLKSSLFYLFFNQLVLAVFIIFTFAVFDPSKIYLALYSFLLSIVLLFLCLSNLTLYLEKAENKSLRGLFANFRITTILLIFALLNMIGIFPAIGGLEKFFLLKIIFSQKLIFAAIMLIINLTALAIFGFRLIYPLFKTSDYETSENDLTLAKDIDLDSSLILTNVVTAIAIFLAIIFYPLITNFFSI